jgi:hypothetical protein
MSSDMSQLTDRAERLIDALANAIMKTAEVAAEKIELASTVAEVRQRMAAFGAVLQAVGAQKAAVAKQLGRCISINFGCCRLRRSESSGKQVSKSDMPSRRWRLRTPSRPTSETAGDSSESRVTAQAEKTTAACEKSEPGLLSWLLLVPAFGRRVICISPRGFATPRE